MLNFLSRILTFFKKILFQHKYMLKRANKLREWPGQTMTNIEIIVCFVAILKNIQLSLCQSCSTQEGCFCTKRGGQLNPFCISQTPYTLKQKKCAEKCAVEWEQSNPLCDSTAAFCTHTLLVTAAFCTHSLLVDIYCRSKERNRSVFLHFGAVLSHKGFD